MLYSNKHLDVYGSRVLNPNTKRTQTLMNILQSRNQNEKLANGILLGINYRVMALEKVETKKGDQVQLVRLRNPLGIPDFVGSWGRE